MRYAIVKGSGITLEKIARYMPGNYKALVCKNDAVLIRGEDNAGWTLDEYVLPRLASGLWFGEEVSELKATKFQFAIDLSWVKAER